jgi:hypothetical protein
MWSMSSYRCTRYRWRSIQTCTQYVHIWCPESGRSPWEVTDKLPAFTEPKSLLVCFDNSTTAPYTEPVRVLRFPLPVLIPLTIIHRQGRYHCWRWAVSLLPPVPLCTEGNSVKPLLSSLWPVAIWSLLHTSCTLQWYLHSPAADVSHPPPPPPNYSSYLICCYIKCHPSQ